MDFLHHLLFGVYPYVGLAVFFLGSWIRYDREQYTWRSYSSQMVQPRWLLWGSNLFHIGILFLFFGHFLGLLIPPAVYHAIGLSTPGKQVLAMITGGIAGVTCLIGLSMLLYRRWSEPRVLANTGPMDKGILILLASILVLGLLGIVASLQHLEGEVMVRWAEWARGIWTVRPDAAALIHDTPWIYKLHVLAGMTLFLLFPFSRLVHVWSGFAVVSYFMRSYQMVRRRGNVARAPGATEADRGRQRS